MDRKGELLSRLAELPVVKAAQRPRSFKSTTTSGEGYKNKQNGMDWYNYPLTGKAPC